MQNGSVMGVFAVGAGGFIGAIARYGMSGLVQRMVPSAAFPAGTLVVNVVGCALIGYVTGLVDARSILSQEARLFLMIGLLGGFTTYSTFGYETFALARGLEVWKTVANVGLHVLLGLAAVWLGYGIGMK